MSKTKNGSIPYERQMKYILHNYDQWVEENKKMRAVLSEINKLCPPDKVTETIDALQKQNDGLKSENDVLKTAIEARKQKLKDIEKIVKEGLKEMGIEVPCYFPLEAKLRSLFQMSGYLKQKEGK